MNKSTVKLLISAFCIISTLLFKTIHGAEDNKINANLANELKLCISHSHRLAPTLFGSFDAHDPEKVASRRKECLVCYDLENIDNDTGNKLRDAYFKYTQRLHEQGRIPLMDLLVAQDRINAYKIKSSSTHFEK